MALSIHPYVTFFCFVFIVYQCHDKLKFGNKLENCIASDQQSPNKILFVETYAINV